MSVELNIIKKPLVTEKSVEAKEASGTYCFEVSSDANKQMVKSAVELAFKVKVSSVRTMMVHGKLRRVGRHTAHRSNWKKAIVKLAEGQKIEMLEQK